MQAISLPSSVFCRALASRSLSLATVSLDDCMNALKQQADGRFEVEIQKSRRTAEALGPSWQSSRMRGTHSPEQRLLMSFREV
jgi:hypothetical protein